MDNMNILESLTEALSENDKCLQEKHLCLGKVMQPRSASASPVSNSNANSLLQHLPNIDVIDEIEFLSFVRESDMVDYVKRHPSCTLDVSGKNGLLKLPGEPIRLTKTTDVTKIKGWRDKTFAQITKKENDVNKASERLNQPKLGECSNVFSSTSSSVDSNCKVEPLDLDIDVFDDGFQNNYDDCVEEDDENQRILQLENVTKPSSNEFKVANKVNNEIIHNFKEAAAKERNTKSAFISDYLDDFLRNNSQLKNNLKTTNRDIDTRVTWPKEASSPSKIHSKIKPPPFPIRQPVKRSLIAESSISKAQEQVLERPIKNVKHDTVVNDNCFKPVAKPKSFETVVIKLTDAIYAANAVVVSARKRKCPKSSKIIKRNLFVSNRQALFPLPSPPLPAVAQPVIAENPLPTKKVDNFLKIISEEDAKFAVSTIKAESKNKFEKQVERRPDLQIIRKSNPIKRGRPRLGDIEVIDLNTRLIASRHNTAPDTARNETRTFSMTKVSCDKPHCQLGCLCESLRVPKRKRRHCGKVDCMLQCVCKQQDADKKAAEDVLGRQKRQIRLPARLKDSFLFNPGRDLPFNIEWDIPVVRKGEIKDETTRLLWKECSKWADYPATRGRDPKRRSFNRVNNQNNNNNNSRPKSEYNKAETVTKQIRTDSEYLGSEQQTATVSSPPSTNFKVPPPPPPPLRDPVQEIAASSSVQISRINLERALNKQLPVINVKRVLNDKGQWKIVSCTKEGVHQEHQEPNQMLPHDWRSVAKPPADNPEFHNRRAVPVGARFEGVNPAYYEMKQHHRRLSMLLAPLVEKIKERNPALLESKSYLMDLAKVHCKQLDRQQLQLLNSKKGLMIERNNRLKKLISLVRDWESEKQRRYFAGLYGLMRSLRFERLTRHVSNNAPRQPATGNSMMLHAAEVQSRNAALGKTIAERNKLVARRSDIYNNAGDQVRLDEPKVVIENDLEDESDSDDSTSTEPSVQPQSRSNFTVRPPSSTSVPKSPNRRIVITNSSLLPGVGQWRKLGPNLSVDPTRVDNRENPSPSVHRLEQNKLCETRKRFLDLITTKSLLTQYRQQQVNSRSLLSGQKVLRTQTETPSTKSESSRVIVQNKSEVRSLLQQKPRFMLCPVERPPRSNGVDKSAGASGAFPSVTVAKKVAQRTNNNNNNFATILIPVSMLPSMKGTLQNLGNNNNNNNNKSMTLGEVQERGGIILQPLVTTTPNPTAVNGVGSHGVTENKSSSDMLAGKFRIPNSRFKLMLKVNQTKQIEAQTSSVSLLSPSESMQKDVVEAAGGTPDFESDSESETNSHAVRDCARDVSASGEENEMIANQFEDEEEQLEFCDNQDDSDTKMEEMPKIVGFTSISEDEFRCEDNKIES